MNLNYQDTKALSNSLNLDDLVLFVSSCLCGESFLSSREDDKRVQY
jgi:hypothetical protein